MKRRTVVHVCAACKTEFKTKRECWWHMEIECQDIEKRRLLNEEKSPHATTDPATGEEIEKPSWSEIAEMQIGLRQLQDARNLWNVSPEDSHESWIQLMQETIENSRSAKKIAIECAEIVGEANIRVEQIRAAREQICECGHGRICHRAESDHDECQVGECECDTFRAVRRKIDWMDDVPEVIKDGFPTAETI